MTTLALGLEIAPDPRVFINDRIWFEDFEETRVVFLDGNLFFHYRIGDRVDQAFVIGTLARNGLARVSELARAFQVDPKTVYRQRKRIESEGAAGALDKKPGPKGAWKLDRALRRRVLGLEKEGLSDRAVGRRIGIDHKSVARILREEGYSPPEPPTLPGLTPEPVEEEEAPQVGARSSAPDRPGPAPDMEGQDEPLAATGLEPGEPSAARPVAEAVPPRLVERALAAGGHLPEAAPVLVSGTNLRSLGLLLAVPCLLETGVLSAAKKIYGRLRPGFYGLTSFFLTLLFMALLRIKRPEGIKGVPPEIVGRMIGLDRSPEVKTIRRKLTELAGRGRSHALLGVLAKRMSEEHEDLFGFLYVDGHVRAYHGKRKLPKTWVPIRRICLPATTDYWVNDAEGEPFFFVTTEGNPRLSKVLPDLLSEVKPLLPDGRATVIFDRGGWSQKAFQKIVRMGFDFITYRTRPYDDLPDELFEEYEVEGRKVHLAEGTAEYGILGKVRIVAKRDPDGSQVHIVTNLEEEELSTAEVYLRMSRRWRQENFFKYMKRENELDALVSYEMVPADPERLVVNPVWKERDNAVRAQRRKIAKLEQELGAGSKEPTEGNRPTFQAFKAAVHETAGDLIEAERELIRRLELRKAVPGHVPLKEAVEVPQMRLEYERKVLTDTLKIAAYRAESALANVIAPEYRRARHEGRKLVQEALHASGDLVVGQETVTVKLEPLSSPHRTQVLETLCETLSEQDAVYPGTKLRLRYELRAAADRAE